KGRVRGAGWLAMLQHVFSPPSPATPTQNLEKSICFMRYYDIFHCTASSTPRMALQQFRHRHAAVAAICTLSGRLYRPSPPCLSIRQWTPKFTCSYIEPRPDALWRGEWDQIRFSDSHFGSMFLKCPLKVRLLRFHIRQLSLLLCRRRVSDGLSPKRRRYFPANSPK